MTWAGHENDPAGPGYHRHRFPVRHLPHRGRPEHARVSWSDPMEPGGAAARPSTGKSNPIPRKPTTLGDPLSLARERG